ncbi:cellulose biosynthesis protein BcsN [Oharaeibacter diazotrophicus]|uniref:Cellulose biosynthesis protein BcsN n=1 Tax=Oharaeibacter diazotrophicus TaxID=1920512 RepID=A0A4R6RAU2_9HYPH|nr:cellulose biosynthesis protein BcsN [Oharaeibacter diazotrophicus]TDP82757.1 hypothetical protein EDD54_4029 [Oharaeibacter diazotrophicus]BBE72481.1 hypothetical protein OHA_1_02076 [Pleomorphomonas sp. SM30]GLS76512.1 hypothetical protein GCM10007904_18490 [Oharaeibacter diazotrophicus]
MTRIAPTLAALALVAALPACAALDAPENDLTATSVSRTPAEAWASLPPAAGAVLSVVEEVRPKLRTQRIVLAGAGSLPGENAVTVRIPGTAGTDTSLLARPTDVAIAAEMAAALPGVPMTVVPVARTTADGPFGAAVGAAGPFHCLYAWQHLERGALAAGPAIVDLRVRLCGRESTDALIAAVAGLRLAPTVAAPAAGTGFTAPVGADALTLATGADPTLPIP